MNHPTILIPRRQIVSDKKGADVLNQTIRKLDQELTELKDKYAQLKVDYESTWEIVRQKNVVLSYAVEMAVSGRTGKEIGTYIMENGK
jgi:hypothetical protein